MRLATAPALTDTLAACRTDDDPMPVLDSANVALQVDGTPGTSATPRPAPTPGTDYFLQVVARDAEDYCQSALDVYYDDDSDTEYPGILGFRYKADGSVEPIAD